MLKSERWARNINNCHEKIQRVPKFMFWFDKIFNCPLNWFLAKTEWFPYDLFFIFMVECYVIKVLNRLLGSHNLNSF